MIDYVEGLIDARQTLQEIESLCRKHDYEPAITLCDELLVIARMLRNQLILQSEKK